MKSNFTALALGLTLSLASSLITSAAQAYGKIRGTEVNSCVITVPSKLKDSERAMLERKGYRFKKDRGAYTSGRVVQKYEYYEMKAKKKVVGNLFIKAIMKPYDLPTLKAVSKREFHLNLVTAKYDKTIGITSSVAPLFARSEQEAKEADFSQFPACVD